MHAAVCAVQAVCGTGCTWYTACTCSVYVYVYLLQCTPHVYVYVYLLQCTPHV